VHTRSDHRPAIVAAATLSHRYIATAASRQGDRPHRRGGAHPHEIDSSPKRSTSSSAIIQSDRAGALKKEKERPRASAGALEGRWRA